MRDLDFSLKHLQESGAQASPLGVDGCNSIWFLDDDASMLRALGRGKDVEMIPKESDRRRVHLCAVELRKCA
jgi:hypothetical protein